MLKEIRRHNADFIALHMQEVGGKNYEVCTAQVPGFVEKIASCLRPLGYATVEAYLDLDYEVADNYVVCIILCFLFFIFHFLAIEFIVLEFLKAG